MPTELNLSLDILTAIDALSTSEYLPHQFDTLHTALAYRISDVLDRRGSDHPTTLAMEQGGRERLQGAVGRFDCLMQGVIPEQEVLALYGVE